LYNNVIIGGSGFIGTHLCKVLSKNSIKILDIIESPFESNFEYCDIKQFDSINGKLGKAKLVVLLAAEHRDDLKPARLYYETNVNGTENVLRAMRKNNVNHLIFTSTVAMYGLNVKTPLETDSLAPFNHYGKSKLEAEKVLINWYNEDSKNRTLHIIRPTVVFGEGNRGNVYNLISQIASGKFAMIGNGENHKSMAYVGNLAFFIKYLLENPKPGLEIYNYTNSPDLTINELVSLVKTELGLSKFGFRIPKWLGLIAGYGFDLVSKLTGGELPISSVRVKKFCANTTFNTDKLKSTVFVSPYTLEEGLKRTIKHDFID